MGIGAKVICDSVSPEGYRLTTLEVCMPRIILAEFNTHRQFSRNSASSRAIPVEKMIGRVMDDPFIPLHWGKNQKGMQAGEELSEEEIGDARWEWLNMRIKAVKSVERLSAIGVHKQIANRWLEPALWHTVIVTASEWSNFFAQRSHPDAMPEMRLTAEAIRDAITNSTPQLLTSKQWHTPYLPTPLKPEELLLTEEGRKDVSAARCARISYLQQDGTRNAAKDLDLAERLLKGMHLSPFEHVARPFSPEKWEIIRLLQGEIDHFIARRGDDISQEELRSLWQQKIALEFEGNFRGWHQMRKDIPNECR